MIVTAVGRDGMHKKDHISLNVPGLLARYSNPSRE